MLVVRDHRVGQFPMWIPENVRKFPEIVIIINSHLFTIMVYNHIIYINLLGPYRYLVTNQLTALFSYCEINNFHNLIHF